MIEHSIITTDHTMKELAEHGTTEFPIFISKKFTFTYDMGIFSWHWHNEFELTYIVTGEFEYSAGQDTFLVYPGETILINSKVLHQIKPIHGDKFAYYSYIFAPEFLCESNSSLLYKKYIYPIIQNRNFPYYVFRKNIFWESACLNQIKLLNQIADSNSFSREIRIQHLIQSVFIELIEQIPGICDKTSDTIDSDSYSLMNIMLCIKEHYQEPISLMDLTNVASISKSSLNRLFRKTLKMTPFEYLQDFRLNQSIQLLTCTNKSITDIASACGFHDVSYYCKIFREKKGISPQKFRKQIEKKDM